MSGFSFDPWGKATPLGPDPIPEEPWTELGYANRLVEVYGDHIRHVGAWRRWYAWNGQRWVHDDGGQVHRWMKIIARRIMEVARAEPDEKLRKTLVGAAIRGESAAGIRGALTLAATMAAVSVAPEDLDADPFLLNVQNGVLDLRTGQLGPHEPSLLLTKITGAAYHPEAAGPEFIKFLEKIQPEEAMRDYLARLFGHALEGRVTEHVLPILLGDGANGKGTLVNAVLGALGDYADAADPVLLVARSFDAHPTSTADLFGLRLAVLHESDQARPMAEGTVKRLTGGDRLKARRMHEDFWSFDPSHSFMMLTNHRPTVGGSDEGIWRRLRLVPFEVIIPSEDRDETLGDQLALERDHLLAWMVAGYRAWKDGGLQDPVAVMEATSVYKADSDDLGRFLEECCETSPGLGCWSSDLFRAYAKWRADEGLLPVTATAFGLEMKRHGFESKKISKIRWVGVALKDDGTLDDTQGWGSG